MLLILVVEINSEEMFYRGKYFGKEEDKTQLRVGSSDRWYYQKLNHFNTGDTRMWWQRYQVNQDYFGWSSHNPIFLKVGGEERISADWMTCGFWVDKAVEHNALIFQLEHRFYGPSRPTDDVSTPNLQAYLNVEQALEDAASFIVSMKARYNLQKNNRWILFGGSYSGNLVAWLRLKYPHLIHGAVSSSSPVQSVVDFRDYFKIVAESLATYSRSCVTTITDAYANIDQLSLTANGQQSLTSKFNLCTPLESSTHFVSDFAQLNNFIAHNIGGVVQYNKGDHSSNKTIDNICDILANTQFGSAPIDRLAALINILLLSNNVICLEYNYQNFVDYFRATSWEHPANNGGRQWFFQTCNQMGYLESSSAEPHVFGNKFPVEHLIKQCADVFGPQYTATFIQNQIQNTNYYFAGKNIVNIVDRVVFVQGSIDPWRALGVVSSTNINSPAIYIIGTSHVADMNSNDFRDSPQLTMARATISGYIRNWLL